MSPVVLTLTGARKAFRADELFRDLSLTLASGEHLCLWAPLALESHRFFGASWAWKRWMGAR